MKLILSTLVLTLASTAAVAGPTCTAAQAQWMKEADFRAKITQQGYQIKTFKVSKGQCYEIYGHDKAGQKVEIYYDPVTAAELQRN